VGSRPFAVELIGEGHLSRHFCVEFSISSIMRICFRSFISNPLTNQDSDCYNRSLSDPVGSNVVSGLTNQEREFTKNSDSVGGELSFFGWSAFGGCLSLGGPACLASRLSVLSGVQFGSNFTVHTDVNSHRE
jgi:hypothetical protein